MSNASKISLLVVAGLFLTGCLNSARFSSLEPSEQTTVVEDRIELSSSGQSSANPDFYLVKPGDTLYSIAFRFGLDYKKLANANQIDSSYRIYEGQSLALKEVTIRPSKSNSAQKSNTGSTSSSSSQTVTKLNSQKNDAPVGVKSNPVTPNLSWKWPHNGKIVRTFSSGLASRKGIDIQGRIGDSVHAATNGVVVYAGNGLPGYGNLIILDHADSLLSAYAFNEKMLVKEKDQVTAGQVIATMGKQGDQPGLHFEIRRDGKPVDPLRYLPKR